jgi:hypothetical protein
MVYTEGIFGLNFFGIKPVKTGIPSVIKLNQCTDEYETKTAIKPSNA